MSYTKTKKQSGNQTQLNINTGTPSSPIWTPIYEIVDIGQSGKMLKTDDATNLNSATEEFIGTISNPGGFSLSINRVSSDPGQIALLASFNAATTVMYQAQLPKAPGQTTTGDLFAFSAIVEEFNDLGTVKSDKGIMTPAKLKASGPITLTVGS
jgi:hypothetical protein